MLEILLLFVLGKKIAQMAKDRGRTAWPWVVLMVFGWYGGAIAGGITAAVIVAIADPTNGNPGDDELFYFIIGALAGGIGGVTFAFVVVSLLPRVERDEDDRPRRRYVYEDERDDRGYRDEDDEPRRRRRYDEDDDYDDRRRR